MWWIAVQAFAGLEPRAELSWSGGETRLQVEAPTGEELSTDGPARLQIVVGPSEIVWSGTGGRLDRGVVLGAATGDEVLVDGTITACNVASGSCRPLDVRFRGFLPDTRKGVLAMQAEAPEGHAPSPFQADAVAAAEWAFSSAKAANSLVLLDFGAIWCPPCNLLSAEVLHADPLPPELSAVSVAALDVDDPSSWAIKDRYAVGGYPTVVVARADGTELGRMVGYPGRESWLRWLAETVARGAPPVNAATLDPAVTAPEQAAEIARREAEAGDKAEAERWLARASDGEDLRVARFLVRPSVEDANWLANRGVAPLGWAPAAVVAPVDPEIAAVARRAFDAALVQAKGPEAADLLTYRRELSPEADRPLLAAAAAAVLRSSFSGDPVLDRGHFTTLADLQAQGGDLEGAVAFLDAQSAHWPEEPTFDLAAARLLNQAKRFADAATRAERALSRSWGDNHLRVAAQLATARVGLGDPEAAAAVARAALAAVPAPPADLAVRTPRYRTALEAFLPTK